MKKIVSILVALALCLGAFATAARTTIRMISFVMGPTISWGISPNTQERTPDAPEDGDKLLSQYNGFYVADTTNDDVYFTFDLGYEAGYTAKVLDILKQNNIKAIFFLCGNYLKEEELVNRMIEEGHIIGNHTDKHKDLPKFDEEGIRTDISTLSSNFEEKYPHAEKMHFFRPPQGRFDEKTLKIAQEMDLRTTLWSIAIVDWGKKPIDAQKNADKICSRIHPGAVILFHITNAGTPEMLKLLIPKLSEKGYQIASPTDLIHHNDSPTRKTEADTKINDVAQNIKTDNASQINSVAQDAQTDDDSQTNNTTHSAQNAQTNAVTQNTETNDTAQINNVAQNIKIDNASQINGVAQDAQTDDTARNRNDNDKSAQIDDITPILIKAPYECEQCDAQEKGSQNATKQNLDPQITEQQTVRQVAQSQDTQNTQTQVLNSQNNNAVNTQASNTQNGQETVFTAQNTETLNTQTVLQEQDAQETISTLQSAQNLERENKQAPINQIAQNTEPKQHNQAFKSEQNKQDLNSQQREKTSESQQNKQNLNSQQCEKTSESQQNKQDLNSQQREKTSESQRNTQIMESQDTQKRTHAVQPKKDMQNTKEQVA